MKKIMIVEDEAVIALGLEQRLTEMGYDVVGTFHSGETAIENARILYFHGPNFGLTTQCGCNMLVIMTILTMMEV